MLTSPRSATDDDLVAAGRPWQVPAILAAGQKLERGAVLGQSNRPSVTVALKAGGNTGSGTLVHAAVAAHARPGAYQVRAVADGESLIFGVTGPGGLAPDEALPGSPGTWACQGAVSFEIANGSTAFVAGDGFDLTVAAASDAYRLSEASAADGSAWPTLVLAQDTDATKGPVETVALRDGYLRVEALILGGGHTPETVEGPLSGSGITLVQLPR